MEGLLFGAIVAYFWFAVFSGLSYKQIFLNYLYFLGISLLISFFQRQFYDINIMFIVAIVILGIYYFGYMRKYIAMDVPVKTKLFNNRKYFLRELENKYLISDGYTYCGHFTRKIKSLKKGNKIILEPIFAYKISGNKGYFLTEQYVTHDLEKDKFDFYSNQDLLKPEERLIFSQLEAEKSNLIKNLEK